MENGGICFKVVTIVSERRRSYITRLSLRFRLFTVHIERGIIRYFVGLHTYICLVKVRTVGVEVLSRFDKSRRKKDVYQISYVKNSGM